MLGTDSGRAVAAVRTLLVFLSILAVLLTGMATVLADPAHAADEGPAPFEEATADRSPFGDTSSETDSDAADPRTDVGSQSGGGEVQDEPHGSGGTQSDSSADQPLANQALFGFAGCFVGSCVFRVCRWVFSWRGEAAM